MANAAVSNRISEVVKARLCGLRSLLEESRQIDHRGTQGALREKYLLEFLESLLPPSLSISGGFICDALGGITPQLDLILAEKSAIPSIALTGDVALIPVETALLAVEVKSTLTSKDKVQIQAQVGALRNLHPQALRPDPRGFAVLLYIFAYDTTVKESTLEKWLREIDELYGICLLGDRLLYKDKPQHLMPTVVGSDNEWEETRAFVSVLIKAVELLRCKRPPAEWPMWVNYLEGIPTEAVEKGLAREQ